VLKVVLLVQTFGQKRLCSPLTCLLVDEGQITSPRVRVLVMLFHEALQTVRRRVVVAGEATTGRV